MRGRAPTNIGAPRPVVLFSPSPAVPSRPTPSATATIKARPPNLDETPQGHAVKPADATPSSGTSHHPSLQELMQRRCPTTSQDAAGHRRHHLLVASRLHPSPRRVTSSVSFVVLPAPRRRAHRPIWPSEHRFWLTLASPNGAPPLAVAAARRRPVGAVLHCPISIEWPRLKD